MRRKIIGQGNNTLTITLPRNWSRKHGIRRGDEIEVNELNDNLLISLKSAKGPRKIEIDVSNLDHNSIRQKIRSVYKKGFDEICIRFENEKITELRTGKKFLVVDVINEEINLLLGCQIIHQTKNSCIIKDFTFGSSEEFENVLRRVFLSLIDFGQDFYSLAETLDKTSLAGMRDRHFNIGKFIFYCLRLINKGINRDLSNSIYLYYIVTTLDDIVDIIKYSSVELLSVKQKKLSKHSLEILKKMIEQNRNFYEYFYKPDNEKILKLANNRWEVRKKISSLKDKLSSSELTVLLLMAQILELYYHISEPRMALDY